MSLPVGRILALHAGAQRFVRLNTPLEAVRHCDVCWSVRCASVTSLAPNLPPLRSRGRTAVDAAPLGQCCPGVMTDSDVSRETCVSDDCSGQTHPSRAPLARLNWVRIQVNAGRSATVDCAVWRALSLDEWRSDVSRETMRWKLREALCCTHGARRGTHPPGLGRDDRWIDAGIRSQGAGRQRCVDARRRDTSLRGHRANDVDMQRGGHSAAILAKDERVHLRASTDPVGRTRHIGRACALLYARTAGSAHTDCGPPARVTPAAGASACGRNVTCCAWSVRTALLITAAVVMFHMKHDRVRPILQVRSSSMSRRPRLNTLRVRCIAFRLSTPMFHVKQACRCRREAHRLALTGGYETRPRC